MDEGEGGGWVGVKMWKRRMEIEMEKEEVECKRWWEIEVEKEREC